MKLWLTKFPLLERNHKTEAGKTLFLKSKPM